MKIQILSSKNAPDMVGKIIEFDKINEEADGSVYADCGRGMVLTDLSFSLMEAEKNSVTACVGGQQVYAGRPTTGTLVYGNSPKNLVLINSYKFV